MELRILLFMNKLILGFLATSQPKNLTATIPIVTISCAGPQKMLHVAFRHSFMPSILFFRSSFFFSFSEQLFMDSW